MMTGTIGIVGGCGVIGRAIARGLLTHEIVLPGDLIISGRTVESAGASRGVRYTSDNAWLARASKVVILSVRPEQFASVHMDAKECLLISVMAGIPTAVLMERTGSVRVIRAMPNAAAVIGRSFTPYHASRAVSAEEKQLVRRIFDAVGKSAEVASESDLDYMTGLTGSGPAFVALLAEAMLSHATARGLEPRLASEAVRATIEGAQELVGHGDATPREILATLMAYRGTTAAALEVMQAKGFASVVAAGLEAAERRAGTLWAAG